MGIHALWLTNVAMLQIMVQFGPAIPESSKQYVHHMVVYLCANLNHTHVGAGIECSDITDRGAISLCRTELIIAAWAVGGQVSHVYNLAFNVGDKMFDVWNV